MSAASPPSLSTLETSSPRNRGPVACERCNRKKVRCDASINGVPCSRCKKSSSRSCKLLKWRRARGPDGRYVLPKSDLEQASSTRSSEDSSIPRPLENSNEIKSRSAKAVPDFDIIRLVSAERDHYSESDSPGDSGILSPSTVGGSSSKAQQDNGTSFVGESWWAHYVLSTSTAAPTELHGLIGKESSSITNDNHSADAPIHSNLSDEASLPSDFPPAHLCRQLIEAYFRRFHIFCPILDRVSFLTSVRDGKVSNTLLRCVFFVASIHCEIYLLNLMGYQTRLDAEDDLFFKARASFDADEASDRTTMILSSFLLHYYSGSIPRKYRDAMWWMSNAIRSAQSMGYHRSTENSRMPEKDKIHWKRIWWCLYIRDRQVCLSLGPPMVINDLDFDVEDLTMDDFPNESVETARYVIAQASLNRVVSNLFFCHCSPRQLYLSRDAAIRQKARRQIRDALQDWYIDTQGPSSGDDGHLLSLILDVCYNYYIVNLQQRLQRLCDPPFTDPEGAQLVLKAADRISTLVDDSLLHWTPERFPLIYVSAIFSAMTAQVADCGIACFEPATFSRKLHPNLLALKQFEQCHLVAQWIRNLFLGIVGHQRQEKNDPNSVEMDASHNTQTERPHSVTKATTNDGATHISHASNIRDYNISSISPQTSTYTTSTYPYPYLEPGSTTDLDERSNISDSLRTSIAPTAMIDRYIPTVTRAKPLQNQHETMTDDAELFYATDMPFFETRGCHQSLHVLADLGLTQDPTSIWGKEFDTF